jgi:hypothetical protein
MAETTDLLVDILERAFRKRSWHGTNLLGSLRGLAPELAAWRPAPGRRNIWEHLVHTAYWKYSVSRRLIGAERGSFPLKGSNWFPRPEETSASALLADMRLLKKCHEDLIRAANALPVDQLDDVPSGSKFTFQQLIVAVAAHDLYHTGQIQLIKRLYRR